MLLSRNDKAMKRRSDFGEGNYNSKLFASSSQKISHSCFAKLILEYLRRNKEYFATTFTTLLE